MSKKKIIKNNEKTVEKFLQQTFEPLYSYRFVVHLDGLKSFLVKYVKSLPNQEMEIGYHLIKGDYYPGKVKDFSTGRIEINDVDGVPVKKFVFTYTDREFLTFNLDYADESCALGRIFFHGVHVYEEAIVGLITEKL